MNAKIYSGFAAVLLFGFFALCIFQVQPVFAKGLAVSASWCGPCQTLKNSTVTLGGKSMTYDSALKQLSSEGKLDYLYQDGNVWKAYDPATNSFKPATAEQIGQASKVESFPHLSDSGSPSQSLNQAFSNKQGALDNINNAVSEEVKPLQNECIFMGVGNVDKDFTPSSPGSGIKIKGSASGYGVYDPSDPTQDSFINKALLKENTTLSQRYSEVLKTAQADQKKNPGKQITIVMPNGAQAYQAANTGKYTTSGAAGSGPSVSAGSKYTVGVTGPDGMTVDEDCNVTQGAAPATPGSPANPFQGLQGPGSGVPGSPGAPGLGGLGGGLGALLPLLMSGMLGGGQNQGNQNGQNGYGAGNGTNTTTNCQAYGVVPVCGSDGTKTTTYTNSCWEQQLGATQVSAGVCPTSSPTPTPQPTPDVAKIVSELVNSGVPTNLVNAVINALNIALLHVSSQVTVP